MSEKTPWLKLDTDRSRGQPTLEETPSEDPRAQIFIVIGPGLRAWIKIWPFTNPSQGWVVEIENNSMGEAIRVTFVSKEGKSRRRLSYYQRRSLLFEPRTPIAYFALRVEDDCTAFLIATRPEASQ